MQSWNAVNAILCFCIFSTEISGASLLPSGVWQNLRACVFVCFVHDSELYVIFPF